MPTHTICERATVRITAAREAGYSERRSAPQQTPREKRRGGRAPCALLAHALEVCRCASQDGEGKRRLAAGLRAAVAAPGLEADDKDGVKEGTELPGLPKRAARERAELLRRRHMHTCRRVVQNCPAGVGLAAPTVAPRRHFGLGRNRARAGRRWTEKKNPIHNSVFTDGL